MAQVIMSSDVAQRLDWTPRRVSRGLNLLLRDSDLFFVRHPWHDEYVILLHFFFSFSIAKNKVVTIDVSFSGKIV